MKRIFLLSILLVLIAGIALAQSPYRTMLRIRLSDNTPISVFLDGRYINKRTTSLTLDGLRPGFHRLEVFSEYSRRRPVRMYTGTIRLERATFYSGIVDVYNRGMRLRARPINDGEDYAGDDIDDRRDDAPRADGSHNDYDEHRNNNTGRTDEVYNDYRGDDGNRSEGYGSFPRGRGEVNSDLSHGYRAFGQGDMDDLRSRVSARITDSDKEELLKSVLKNRSYSSDQVRQMLGWLSFESTRLDFAKWAYGNVSDRRNYWKLEDAFDFSASKKEFTDYIR